MNGWTETGCGRGHDITNAANVRLVHRGDGRTARVCRVCDRARSRGYRNDPEPRQPDRPRDCLHCGNKIIRKGREGLIAYEKRKYCTIQCSNLARLGARLAARKSKPRRSATTLQVVDYVPDDPLWRLQAACRENPDLFFPEGATAAQREAEAKAICRRCPVRATCLAWALAAREPHGVYGGLSAEERLQLAAAS